MAEFLSEKDHASPMNADGVTSTPITGLSMAKISEKLHELIVIQKADNETVLDWIDSESYKERLDPREITSRNDLLQKYLNQNQDSELQALFALQTLVTKLLHPPGLLRSMLDTFYDDDIISEEAVFQWEKTEEEPFGKGAALQQAVQFLTWLKETEDES